MERNVPIRIAVPLRAVCGKCIAVPLRAVCGKCHMFRERVCMCVCVCVCLCVCMCVFLIYIFILHAPLLWAILHALVVSYTATYVHLIILTFLDTSLSSYLLDLYSLSNDILSVNFLNSIIYLFISVSLLTGQFSDRSTAALSCLFFVPVVHIHRVCGLLFVLLFCMSIRGCP